MMLWVVVLRASETKICCKFSHSSMINRVLILRIGLSTRFAYWLGCLKP